MNFPKVSPDSATRLCRPQIAIVGNPNTGKSCLFNQLTTMDAIVSNYPGTTVEILKGKTEIGDKLTDVADLPGIYNLGSSSEDERVTAEYVFENKISVIVNVIDAALLERNLYLTLQLLQLQIPVVIALNFYNKLEDKGISVDHKNLSTLLGVPVILIDALKGEGVPLLVNTIKSIVSGAAQFDNSQIIRSIVDDLGKNHTIKTQIAAHRHSQAAVLAEKVVIKGKRKKHFKEFLDKFTTEPLTGGISLILVMGAIFLALFNIGNFLSELMAKGFEMLIMNPLTPLLAMISFVSLHTIVFWGLQGVNAGLQIIVPYIFVFYLMLGVLEDTGYLPRMAYLLDKLMHKMHLHGNAVIPMMLGFGCSVPAVLATRILPNKKDRLLTSILICMIPCSARTAVILGAVGKFVGAGYAMIIYFIVLLLIFVLGQILGKLLPGDSVGLIMEMPQYRLPQFKNIMKKTWMRMKDFIWVAFPLIIAGSCVLGLLKVYGLLDIIVKPFSPVINGWLMLPSIAGITLIYGILRKEMALELLFVLGGSSNLLRFMTPLQIFIFALVVALYFPCIGTFAVLKNEFGWKKSLLISFFTIVLAVTAGGLIARLFTLANLLH